MDFYTDRYPFRILRPLAKISSRFGSVVTNSVADPDPGSGAFLTPVSGIRIRIRDEQPGSYFRELKNKFFGLKYLNSLMRIRDGKKFGSGIRDGKNSDPGSRINLPEPQHWLPQIIFIVTVTKATRESLTFRRFSFLLASSETVVGSGLFSSGLNLFRSESCCSRSCSKQLGAKQPVFPDRVQSDIEVFSTFLKK